MTADLFYRSSYPANRCAPSAVAWGRSYVRTWIREQIAAGQTIHDLIDRTTSLIAYCLREREVVDVDWLYANIVLLRLAEIRPAWHDTYYAVRTS